MYTAYYTDKNLKGMVINMSSVKMPNSTLTASYYLSKYYTNNRNLKASSGRKDVANSLLISNDSTALKKFINDMKSIDTDSLDSDDKSTNHKNKVSAFVSVYNNFLSSCGKSSDHYNTGRLSKIKKITKNNQKELESIGITINKDSSLSIDTDKLEKSDIKKVANLFSKNSDYIKELSKYSSKINITV